MGRRRRFLEQLAEDADLLQEPMPGQTIVELAGDSRVLIENHKGVSAYGRERIVVRVRYGFLIVCGCDMELRHMSREQLVICGRINGVNLQRRG